MKWDTNVLKPSLCRHKRPGPVHILGARTFLVRFARILASAENLTGGGGGDSCTFFFLTPPESVLYFSIGLEVHDILQVISAKMIDEQKKN